MMKKSFSKYSLFVLFFLLVSAGPVALAQGQRMQGMRIAFITQDLALSTAQAEKFWPVYNEYATKRKAIRQTMRADQLKASSESTSDAEIYAAVDEIVALRRQEIELTNEYLPRLKKVLTARQVGRLITLEKRLAKHLLTHTGSDGMD